MGSTDILWTTDWQDGLPFERPLTVEEILSLNETIGSFFWRVPLLYLCELNAVLFRWIVPVFCFVLLFFIFLQERCVLVLLPVSVWRSIAKRTGWSVFPVVYGHYHWFTGHSFDHISTLFRLSPGAPRRTSPTKLLSFYSFLLRQDDHEGKRLKNYDTLPRIPCQGHSLVLRMWTNFTHPVFRPNFVHFQNRNFSKTGELNFVSHRSLERYWFSASYEVKSCTVAHTVILKAGIKETENRRGKVKFLWEI